MSSVAFVGIGIMGLPMAVNLARAGHDVVAVVRSESAARRATSAGLACSQDLEEAVAGAEVVITMLPDTPEVRAVVEQMAPRMAGGALLIDMSTIDPDATRAIRRELLPATAAMLDAPVSGGEAGAIEGALSIMVGGDARDVERAMPLFEAMGKTIVHVGGLGAGQVVKAANQLIVAGNIQLVAEALVLLGANDADLPAALDVLAGGLAGSTVLERKRAAFLERSYDPGFRLTLHAKDLRIVQAAASDKGLSLPLTAAVTQLVRASVARGDGHLDHSALLKLALELNGSQPVDD